VNEDFSFMSHGRRISVVGLGYVGLPVAVSFARNGDTVIAFDIDVSRIEELKAGHDRTREIDPADLEAPGLQLTSDPEALKTADFHIVTVPTPINADNEPDLGALRAASKTLGRVLKAGDIVVYESTVYPGATEEDCVPVLEAGSGLRLGDDFTVGYSPERINPGDMTHRFETIKKVVSGSDAKTLDIVAEVYGSVVTAGIHKAPNIRTAEAAKVIENTQRDLNIAFMNELSVIFDKLGIDTGDVLAAASTKWNFLPFSPGLVGGHCIGVDPFYLTHRAEKAGIHPRVILAGRETNDSMGTLVANKVVALLGGDGSGRQINVLGVTFKENIPDVRNTKVVDVVNQLKALGCTISVADPEADRDLVKEEYDLDLVDVSDLPSADAVVVAVPHRQFAEAGWSGVLQLLKNAQGPVVDVRGMLDRDQTPEGVALWRL